MEAFFNWFEVRALNVYLLLGLVFLFLGAVVHLFFLTSADAHEQENENE